MNGNRRVVVTGIGVICALGKGKEEVAGSLKSFKKSMSFLSNKKEYGNLNNLQVGYINDIEDGLVNELDKSERLVRLAIDEALEDAGLTKGKFMMEGDRIVLSLSTSVMGSDYMIEYASDYEAEHLLNSKRFVTKIAREYGIEGGCYTTSSACASGTAALGVAYDSIKYGDTDIVISGGADHISDISIYGFNALATNSARICRPFKKERDGINIGEGSAFFIFEELEHALSRKRKIYGEVLGYGLSNDAYHMTSPDPSGQGAARSMIMACDEAGLCNDEKIFVNTHGTGTPANDIMELNAIRKCFMDQKVDFSSTKNLTGHCLGAAGAIEFAFSLFYLDEGIVDKTYNTDLEIEKNMVDNTAYESVTEELDAVVSNSFAFGGNNATIVLRK